MTYKLLQNIDHGGEYNGGGITNVYLLDIRDFESYRFAEDSLYFNCFVERINTLESFYEIGTVNESTFSETQENGIYKQQLTTFVHTIEGEKSSDLLIAASNKHLVAFRNSQGHMYCFGSDGGVSLQYTQISGGMGETAGYQVTLSKNSIYPLFQIDADKFNTVQVLATEVKQVITVDEGRKAVLVY